VADEGGQAPGPVEDISAVHLRLLHTKALDTPGAILLVRSGSRIGDEYPGVVFDARPQFPLAGAGRCDDERAVICQLLQLSERDGRAEVDGSLDEVVDH
jgi:hypothetical protein